MVLDPLGRNKASVRRQYRRFVLEGLKEKYQERYYKVKDQRYLGQDEFAERVEAMKKSPEGAYWEIPIEEITLEVMDKTGSSRILNP
jgi:hypothetical protein